MKKISDVINKTIFINAFKICKSYSEKDNHTDINLLLLKDAFRYTSVRKIEDYYDKYIDTELFYGIPYLYSTDIVTIPKNVNGLREYRFFTMMSMVLYNAIGLLFVDVCNEFVSMVKFEKCDIFHFSPTKFSIDNNGEWISHNEYSVQYRNYCNKLKEKLEVNDVVLKIDISNYFNTMSHAKLVEMLCTLGLESKLAIYNIDENAKESLLFYFESLMNKKEGIPQGKINCVSDFFGLLYLLKLDFKIKEICEPINLEFKSMLRYVDDTVLILKNEKGLKNKEVFKELSKLEQALSVFFNNELGLRINEKKTEYKILKSEEDLNLFISNNIKKVSNKDEEISTNLIDNKVKDFLEVLKKYRFNNNTSFQFNISSDEKEKLKVIFENKCKSYMNKSDIKMQITNIIADNDIELTVGEMYILIALFCVKDKNKNFIYLKYLINSINKNFNPKDKRIIHILLILLSQLDQKSISKKIDRLIEKYKRDLEKDNYGKYILILRNVYKVDENVDMIEDESIFNQLCYEYHITSNTRKGAKILATNKTEYYKFIKELSRYDKHDLNEAIINQIKYFVYYYKKENWDSSFNHFQNIFHEICKEKYKLEDKCDVNTIISKLYNQGLIEVRDEVLIRKFYDRRNFNPVSHPSKNGKASVKISREVLNDFKDDILSLMLSFIEYKDEKKR